MLWAKAAGEPLKVEEGSGPGKPQQDSSARGGRREAAAKPRARDPITEGKGAHERPTVGRQRGPECCLDVEGREKEAEVTLRIHISGGSRKGARIGGHPSLPHHPLSARSPHRSSPTV